MATRPLRSRIGLFIPGPISQVTLLLGKFEGPVGLDLRHLDVLRHREFSNVPPEPI
jgi:hypothetical protein